VSILDQAAVERILGLPEGVEMIAYLCIGYPVEFRPMPLLQEVGWKERERLQTLLFKDRWGTPAPLAPNSWHVQSPVPEGEV
jgi:5,6-dimethylbenzimidazole synthase